VKTFLKDLPDPAKRPGVRRLLLRIVQRRQKAQGKLVTIMDELNSHQTLASIDKKSSALLKTNHRYPVADKDELISFAEKNILPAMEKFLLYDPFVEHVDAVEELHAMRLAAKSLRYTLECFTSIYENGLEDHISTMRRIQEYLGIIHDCDIWESSRIAFIEDERRRIQKYFGTDRPMQRLIPGLTIFFDYRNAQRKQSYTAFVKYWRELRKRHQWETLRELVMTARSNPERTKYK
jgi:CHAD domain-containing protein